MPEATKGDQNCDGDVGAVDALKTLQYVAALPYSQNAGCAEIGSEIIAAAQPVGANNVFGDMDCDSDVDAVDALRILRYVVGLPMNLPDGCAAIQSS